MSVSKLKIFPTDRVAWNFFWADSEGRSDVNVQRRMIGDTKYVFYERNSFEMYYRGLSITGYQIIGDLKMEARHINDLNILVGRKDQ